MQGFRESSDAGVTGAGVESVDFLARLLALVPAPGVNLTRFHGVFAPNPRLRGRIVPGRSLDRVGAVEGAAQEGRAGPAVRVSVAEGAAVLARCQGQVGQVGQVAAVGDCMMRGTPGAFAPAAPESGVAIRLKRWPLLARLSRQT